jgi:hypothetical protein
MVKYEDVKDCDSQKSIKYDTLKLEGFINAK